MFLVLDPGHDFRCNNFCYKVAKLSVTYAIGLEEKETTMKSRSFTSEVRKEFKLKL